MATVASTRALSASRAASICGASALKARAQQSNARPAVRRARNAQTTTKAYFDDGADFGGGDSGVAFLLCRVDGRVSFRARISNAFFHRSQFLLRLSDHIP